jgi:ribonuclease-3
MGRVRTGNGTGGKGGRALEARLGHVFADASLLERALCHSSALDRAAAEASNQRLEFLGDRVLGLVMAEWLLRRFPQADEGELAVRYNALVRKEACAEIAAAIGLGLHLRLGAGEERAGGREKAAILADACEAVIAALYLDGGLDAARRFIEAEWAALVAAPARLPQDAKTVLQEWTQGKGRGVPAYEQVERTGPDHAPLFTVRATVKGLAPVTGTGASKRQAEQAAAREMLVREGVWSANE